MGRLLRLFSLSLSMVFLAPLSYANITIEQERVRAMPPGQVNSAAFFIVHNDGKEDIELTEVRASVAKKSEFHQHIMDAKGVMKMSRVMSILLKAGASFEFKPGAHHIMLMGLKQDLIPGQTSVLTLIDSNQNSYEFTFPVVSIMAAQKMGSANPFSENMKNHDHHMHN